MAIKRRIVEVFRREKIPESEVRRHAISEGLNAVKECWPDTRLNTGDIMMLDMNTKTNNKANNKDSKYFPNALMNKCGPLNKGQVLLVFKSAANAYCKKQGREPLF